ncbi:MAG TPA: phage head closure protein [Pelagibacterium sp.]|uniref:phage head closure protein n=1 Tax=Pelagibacterium sp. TaxID=1967288 RepID=UPI002D0BBFFB|nr:phage head closure protein [Pelagibacterium sp.]HWJ88516.1 phage head closure protein [Pelagibacterium sp.]
MARKIDAGSLDRRIALERYGVTRDEWNNPIEGWAELAKVWAEKRDVSDTERLRGAEVGSTLTTRFVIRWNKKVTDLNTKDRLTCDGLIYGVVGVKELGRREYIEITAAARSDLFNLTPAPEPGP